MVDSEGDVGEHTSLALDAARLAPHQLFRLIHQRCPEGTPGPTGRAVGGRSRRWKAGAEVGDSVSISLALDGGGPAAHQLKKVKRNSGLKYAWHDGTTWQIEKVDSGGGVDALATTGTGWGGPARASAMCKIYKGGIAEGASRNAVCTGTTWQIETVDSEGVACLPGLGHGGQASHQLLLVGTAA